MKKKEFKPKMQVGPFYRGMASTWNMPLDPGYYPWDDPYYAGARGSMPVAQTSQYPLIPNSSSYINAPTPVQVPMTQYNNLQPIAQERLGTGAINANNNNFNLPADSPWRLFNMGMGLVGGIANTINSGKALRREKDLYEFMRRQRYTQNMNQFGANTLNGQGLILGAQAGIDAKWTRPVMPDGWLNRYNPNNIPVSDNTTYRFTPRVAANQPIRVIQTGKSNTQPVFSKKEKKEQKERSDFNREMKRGRVLAERADAVWNSQDAQGEPFFSREYWTNTAAGEKMRFFPESVDGMGEVFDNYMNPFKMVGDMADALSHSFRPEGTTTDKLLAVAAPLAAGALGGIGAKNVSQWANNTFNPVPISKGAIRDLRERWLTRYTDAGTEAIKRQYSDPEFYNRVRSYYDQADNQRAATDIVEGIVSRADEIQPVVTVYKPGENHLGMYYPQGNWSDLANKATMNFGKFQHTPKYTAIHEQTHFLQDVHTPIVNKSGEIVKYQPFLDPAVKNEFLKPFGQTYKSYDDAVKKFTEVHGRLETLGDLPADLYYSHPMEVQARMNEIRHYLNPKNPWKKITDTDIDKIMSNQKIPGGTMLKYIKDKKALKDAFNKMWVAAPAAVAASQTIDTE